MRSSGVNIFKSPGSSTDAAMRSMPVPPAFKLPALGIIIKAVDDRSPVAGETGAAPVTPAIAGIRSGSGFFRNHHHRRARIGVSCFRNQGHGMRGQWLFSNKGLLFFRVSNAACLLMLYSGLFFYQVVIQRFNIRFLL